MLSGGPFHFSLITALLLMSATAACTSGSRDASQQTQTDAQATSVRRTAVAEVQRIIQGNFNPTATPEPSATPAPDCSGAIWWYEARAHVGEARTIQGPVVSAKRIPNARTLLEIGQPYPDPSGLTVVLPAGDEARLTGRTVCVSGRIGTPAVVPTMELRDASAIFVLN